MSASAPPTFADFNGMRQTGAIARGQWFSATFTHFFERPSDDPNVLEVWCYTDRLSYTPGDVVSFHVSTSAPTFSLEVVRDGADARPVLCEAAIKGALHSTPGDAYATGCGWPAAFQWRIPPQTPCGGYLVLMRVRDSAGREVEQQHFFVVRALKKQASMVLIAATATWTAYNDWGGASHYEGIDGPANDQYSPRLSLKRPWSRGFIWLPKGAPRIPVSGAELGAIPRYPAMEFAFANGFAKYYAAAGWASYERHFVHWAEANGFSIDVITQHDLHFDPHALDGYKCAVIVGHDEYWSRPMRDHLDRWVESGGKLARFGANFLWQIRMEEEGATQVCYKYRAGEEDPVRDGKERHLLTSAWEDARVDHPGARTMGLNALGGIYARVGGTMPRGARGFTVYRPDHWVFAGSDAYYGDIFGAESGVFGFEVDGVDYTFADGLPLPTFSDGAPGTLEILAMGPATLREEDHGAKGAIPYIGSMDAEFAAAAKFGEATADTLHKARYGAGMIAIFQRGEGEVFNAGSCEWVVGLAQHDPQVEIVTRNVLRRYAAS